MKTCPAFAPSLRHLFVAALLPTFFTVARAQTTTDAPPPPLVPAAPVNSRPPGPPKIPTTPWFGNKPLPTNDELNALQNELTGFRYIPTLSREEWNGRSGYVHAAYEEIVNAAELQINEAGLAVPAPASFYLCGWKNMIDEARQRIAALGYDKKSIHLELYG